MAAVVSALHVYPVKSLGGFAPARWEVGPRGLRLDRRWMIVDADGVFRTQRTHPRLALARAVPSGQGIRLDAPGLDPLEVPPGRPGERLVSVRIWNDRCTALPCGAAADEWVTALTGQASRLVYMPDDARRAIEPNDAGVTGQVTFVDAYPLLILSEGSLEGLNARLASPVPMNRFRPNLVVSGVEPHAEDGWTDLEVGALRLVVAKPCERCAITTVDQETAEIGREPLRTLATYRRRNGGVYFGQNAVADGAGTLGVAMSVSPRPRRG